MKDAKPRKGSYVSTSIGSINYFVFHDCKVVCFATNVQMGRKVARNQPDGVLRYPQLLPAYYKFMCGANQTGQQKSVRCSHLDVSSSRSSGGGVCCLVCQTLA